MHMKKMNTTHSFWTTAKAVGFLVVSCMPLYAQDADQAKEEAPLDAECFVAGYMTQVTYTHAAFANYCAAFSEDEDYFVYQVAGKPRVIPYADTMDEAYLVDLASQKSLKLKALDMLFIDRAIAHWQVARRSLGYERFDSGLGIKVLREGGGDLPVAGDTVWVHYTGYLEDGTIFDSSRERGTPFHFTLGRGRVIKGWDEGVARLRKGTRAWLSIPPDIAYGNRQRGPIPPNATLLFDIEILDK